MSNNKDERLISDGIHVHRWIGESMEAEPFDEKDLQRAIGMGVRTLLLDMIIRRTQDLKKEDSESLTRGNTSGRIEDSPEPQSLGSTDEEAKPIEEG